MIMLIDGNASYGGYLQGIFYAEILNTIILM